ncbi:NRDE family protein [Ureibacillus sp. NPDC094379]
MCLVNFHFQQHSKYKLIVVANRDEEYGRPTQAAHFWEDEPNLLAGRDILQKGTWLGISKNGRFAALTNYRDPSEPPRPFSRGDLVRNFLTNNQSAASYINELKQKRELYGGYNLLVGNGEELFHYNNVLDETNIITPGSHSVSNASLNSPWPKVTKGRTRLQEYIDTHPEEVQIEELFSILLDREQAPDSELPTTGVGIEMERNLSSLFIQIPDYGTRSSTVVLIDQQNNVNFVERTYIEGEFDSEKRFSFQVK